MSETVVVEQGSFSGLRAPLPLAGASAPRLAVDGLRPDIAMSLVLVPLTVILCCAWGVRPNLDVRPFAYAMSAVVLVALLPTYFLFLATSVLGLRGEAPGLTLLSTACFLRNCAMLAVMSWVYSHLKAGVLLGTTCDLLLRECDRLLLGGADAWSVCRGLVPVSCAPLLAGVYLSFLLVIVGSIFWLTLTGRTQAADALTCSIVLGYYLGVFAYHILPSYGPAYLQAEARPDVIAPSIVFLQQVVLDGTQAVQQDPAGAVVLPWTYVAAFPSLHLSHVLILTWYMRYSRLTLTLMAVYSLLTAIGTLYFGWHYLTDLLGGTAVALLALWLSGGSRQAGSTRQVEGLDG